ncbi:hypothetical protein I4U23_002276 [Adineta vaga]|nr:hypothetical protein I4U23_002276 [Adineta vaga]
MPELFVLQPAVHNRKNPSFRQSSKLLTYNQPSRKPTNNSFKQRTEVYYVPDTKKNGPIYNKQPHKSPTPSAHSDDLIPHESPGLYHLPVSVRTTKPTARKIYYKPLRYEPRRAVPPYKPLTPPVRKAYSPPPPFTKSTRTSSPPMRKSTPLPSPPVTHSYPSPSPPVTKYQPLTLDGPELYHLGNDDFVHREPTPIVQQSYKSPSPPLSTDSTSTSAVEQLYKSPLPSQNLSARPPSLPVNTFHPPPFNGPELYHLNRNEIYKQPVHEEPSYKTSPPPPTSAKQSTPPPSIPVNVFHPPVPMGPELYHLNKEETQYPLVSEEPKRVESSYKSPPPPPTSAKQSTPPPSIPVNVFHPPVLMGPELYHLKKEETQYPLVSEEPKRVESSYKSPLPPPSSAKLMASQPPPSHLGPELYHLNKELSNRPPTPEEPKYVEQPYRSPPPPIQTISPTPLQFMPKSNTPPHNGPELYHMRVDDAPIPIEQPYHSPLSSAKKPSPLPAEASRPPSRDGPELYYLKADKPELYYIKFDEPTEPQVETSKPSTPRIPSGKNRVSPMLSVKSLRTGPEMYHLQPVVDTISRSPSVHEIVKKDDSPAPAPITTYPTLTKVQDNPAPTRKPSPQPPPRRRTPTPSPPPRRRTPTPPRRRAPTPPRRRSPVARPIRTAAPLTLPNRKPKRPTYDDVYDVPRRRPSFSTALQNVLTSDRDVPLSTSKASDSIIRSMNKFRFPEE